MAKKTSLNKGLEALLGDVVAPKETKSTKKTASKTTKTAPSSEISIAKLKPININQEQPLMKKNYKNYPNQ